MPTAFVGVAAELHFLHGDVTLCVNFSSGSTFFLIELLYALLSLPTNYSGPYTFLIDHLFTYSVSMALAENRTTKTANANDCQ